MNTRRPAQPGTADGPETYWITRPAQIRALVSTRRQDIVDQLAGGGAMTIKELARVIGVAPGSLYYHVQLLCRVGLLRVAQVRHSGPKPEQVYETPARRMRLLQALQQPGNRRVMKAVVRGLCRQAERDFARGIDAAGAVAGGPQANLRFFRLVGRPDAATLERINAHLEAAAGLMFDSARGAGAPLTLTWVGAPQPAPRARRPRA
jgi:AcrR family transcriptional regulator